jgi:penicillin-binding protein 1A
MSMRSTRDPARRSSRGPAPRPKRRSVGRTLLKVLAVSCVALLLLAIAGAGGALYLLHQYGKDLPDYRQLADYQPPTVTRIHAGDGRLLAEYAQEKRVFVPVEVMPKRLIQAFLAAEDKNFYSHPGIDPLGILRALSTNLLQFGQNRRPVGASTITQQVAKNFLLSNEVTYERKVKEALLALRIERAYTKDQILELYLNEIYLGLGSYGVAAASLNYFNKSLDELTTAEAAFLAGLPKAPSRYHPQKEPAEAKGRRDWVISRMLILGYIDQQEAAIATAEPLVMHLRDATDVVKADFFTEAVRRKLVDDYGESALYGGGLSIRTTVAPDYQALADHALRDGLITYDRRTGWRGPKAHLADPADWRTQLAAIDRRDGRPSWQLALVTEVRPEAATIGLLDGTVGEVPLAEVTWARQPLPAGKLGPEITSVDQVLRVLDVIWVEAVPVKPQAEGATAPGAAQYGLRQTPEVEGALVALDPHNGRVLAMTGGFSYARSEFNRATQALRQPGSALKPFVYLAGLESGYTPSSIFLDAPIVIEQGGNQGKWKPANYTRRFYGPSTLRLGIEKSRNLMTVRLADAVGMDKVVEMVGRFGLERGMGYNLASALGASETDLLTLTTAYAMLVNGGKRIQPALIERIQDRHGRTVMRRDQRPCPECQEVGWVEQPTPLLEDQRPQVIDPARAYQMVNLLQGVVERGTGRRAAEIGKPIAGKTGTSNDSRDAWFVGFTPDLVVGVYVGYDQPRSLGDEETGSSAALPVFVEFMEEALKDKPATPFRVPSGVRLVRVDAQTGLLPSASSSSVILEAFLPGTEPTTATPTSDNVTTSTGIVSGSQDQGALQQSAPKAGGLY